MVGGGDSPVPSPIAGETRWVYAGGMADTPRPRPAPDSWDDPEADQWVAHTMDTPEAMAYLQWLIEADRRAALMGTAQLWQVVLTVGDLPAADETAARAVLVAIGLDGEKIELEPEEPDYGIWLVALPYMPLPLDEKMTAAASEHAFVIANGEFQMEVPLP